MKLNEIAQEPLVISMLRKLLKAGNEVYAWWTSPGGDQYAALVTAVDEHAVWSGEYEVFIERPRAGGGMENDTFLIDADKWTIVKHTGEWWLHETE